MRHGLGTLAAALTLTAISATATAGDKPITGIGGIELGTNIGNYIEGTRVEHANHAYPTGLVPSIRGKELDYLKVNAPNPATGPDGRPARYSVIMDWSTYEILAVHAEVQLYDCDRGPYGSTVFEKARASYHLVKPRSVPPTNEEHFTGGGNRMQIRCTADTLTIDVMSAGLMEYVARLNADEAARKREAAGALLDP